MEILETLQATGQRRLSSGSPWTPYTLTVSSDIGYNASIGHPYPFRSGGPWTLSVTSVRSPPITANGGRVSGAVICPSQLTGDVLPSADSLVSDTQLDVTGTRMIARSIPTTPSFSLATTLGELRSDGLPSMVGGSLHDTTRSLRSKAGNEYLNVEFGWLPLIRDLRQFCYNVRNSRKIVDRYRRQADRVLKRRYEDPVSTVVSTYTGSGFLSPSVGNIGCFGTRSSITTSQRWYEGAFVYHIPMGDDQYSKFLRYEAYANQILGTRLTPAAVWNLAPWSWAADWFTNAGDVMTNISQLGSDGLVMRYGYVMARYDQAHAIRVKTITTEQGIPAGTQLSYDKTVKYRQRRVATPYGFGIDETTLSTRQLAVLAALGLSKGRR